MNEQRGKERIANLVAYHWERRSCQKGVFWECQEEERWYYQQKYRLKTMINTSRLSNLWNPKSFERIWRSDSKAWKGTTRNHSTHPNLSEGSTKVSAAKSGPPSCTICMQFLYNADWTPSRWKSWSPWSPSGVTSLKRNWKQSNKLFLTRCMISEDSMRNRNRQRYEQQKQQLDSLRSTLQHQKQYEKGFKSEQLGFMKTRSLNTTKRKVFYKGYSIHCKRT